MEFVTFRFVCTLLTSSATSYYAYSVYQESQVLQDEGNMFLAKPSWLMGKLGFHQQDPSDDEWYSYKGSMSGSMGLGILGHVIIAVIGQLLNMKSQTLDLIEATHTVVWSWVMFGHVGLLILIILTVCYWLIAATRSPKLAWAFTVAVMTLLMLQANENVMQTWQDKWVEDYHSYSLFITCFVTCCARCLSYTVEYSWLTPDPTTRWGIKQLNQIFCFNFYMPVYVVGPVILYKDYKTKILLANNRNSRLFKFAGCALRLGFHVFLTELMVHLLPVKYIAGGELMYLISIPTLCGVSIFTLLLFYTKYMVIYGVGVYIAEFEGSDAPSLPKCTMSYHSYRTIWRYFDNGLYRWFVRYIYIPMGGRQQGWLRQTVASFIIYMFVVLWHGLTRSYLYYWAMSNLTGLVIEKMIMAVYRKYTRWFSTHTYINWIAVNVFQTLGAYSLMLVNLIFAGTLLSASILNERFFLIDFPNFTTVAMLTTFGVVQTTKWIEDLTSS